MKSIFRVIMSFFFLQCGVKDEATQISTIQDLSASVVIRYPYVGETQELKFLLTPYANSKIGHAVSEITRSPFRDFEI